MNLNKKTRIKNIINHLRENSRISHTNIAKKEGVVTSRIHFLSKVVEKEYIQKYVTLLNYEKIQHPFRTISIIKQKPNQEKQVNTLQRFPQINTLQVLNNESIMLESIHKTLTEQEQFIEDIEEQGTILFSQHNIIEVLAQEQWRIK